MFKNKYVAILIRLLIVIAITVVGGFAIYFIGKITIPFIIGFIISFVIQPLVDFYQEKAKMRRGFAVLSAMITIVAVISAAITLLVNEAIQGFTYLSKIIPVQYEKFSSFMEEFYLTKIYPYYQNLLNVFRGLEQSERSTVLESMQMIGSKLTDAFSNLVQAMGNGLYLTITKIPNVATILVISLLATFFISKDWHIIIRKMHQIIPQPIHSKINKIYEGLQRALLGFLKAEFKLTFISAVITFIGLLILQVNNALAIALIIWIVDFLPYVGAILIFLPWAVYSFATGNIFLGIGLSILYGLIVLQRQLIKPKILSSSIGISPLLVLVTMYIGFKLIGLIGIVVGPITFIFIKILYETEILKEIWDYIYLGKKNSLK